MRRSASLTWMITLLVAGAVWFLPTIASAAEASGKVVWVDTKNAALLLVCTKGGCKEIPKSKTGAMYTFIIPGKLKDAVHALKEGEPVKVMFEDRDGGGYTLTNVKQGL